MSKQLNIIPHHWTSGFHLITTKRKKLQFNHGGTESTGKRQEAKICNREWTQTTRIVLVILSGVEGSLLSSNLKLETRNPKPFIHHGGQEEHGEKNSERIFFKNLRLCVKMFCKAENGKHRGEMTAPREILDLIERFERNIDSYCSPAYNEAQLRREQGRTTDSHRFARIRKADRSLESGLGRERIPEPRRVL